MRKAQEWQRLPYVGLQIIVVSGAYIGERDLDILQDRRGEVVKRLLVKLGVRSSEIYVEPKTLTDVHAKKLPDGRILVNQIEIEISPLCKDGCERMCDHPRLAPQAE